MRLSTATLGQLPAGVSRFGYDRETQAVGIVHFGIGAFHRAHQAWYTDRAMDAGDRDWAITGISLRSRDVATRMNPQGGLYTVTERSAAGSQIRVVGAVRNVVPANRARRRVEGLVSAASTRIASFTITEKGYCRAADGTLDPALAGENSVFPFLAAGLRRRRDTSAGGLTLLSCDNLARNGEQFARLIAEYLDRHDPSLCKWFERECACPSSMVDRIVPATGMPDTRAVAAIIGVEDAAAVITEPFSQWVIEDRFAAGRPAWDKVGAQLVVDVTPYETAKLRMLNGAHSALAYLGLQRGYNFVHEAVTDTEIVKVVRTIMLQEAAPSIVTAPGQDLGAYAGQLLERFRNPELRHALNQIATDGSQKIPQRWLETLAFHSARGEHCPGLLLALSAWLSHLEGNNHPVSDPFAEKAKTIWRAAGVTDIARAMFGPEGQFAASWVADEIELQAITLLLEARNHRRHIEALPYQ